MEKISEGMLALESLFGELTDEEILASKVRHEISKTIIQSRLKLRLSQSKYAKRLGVSQGMVSRWESGDYNFTTDTLAKIAVKLGLELKNPLQDKYDSTFEKSYKFSLSKEEQTTSISDISTFSWDDLGGVA